MYAIRSYYDASMGYFNSALIDIIAVVFMLIAGINFTLHFLAWQHTSLKPYRYDTELKAYFTILLAVSVITCAYLFYTNAYSDYQDLFKDGIFQRGQLNLRHKGLQTLFSLLQDHR